MNYVIAGIIIAIWCWLAGGWCWNPKASTMVNIVMILITIFVIGIIHWVPFYLIFIK